MYTIKERQDADGTFYEVTVTDSQRHISLNKCVRIRTFNTVTEDGTPVIMFYNPRMVPIEPAIRFINFGGMHGQSQNYVLQTVTALKLLYSYLYIYDIELETMQRQDAIGYLDFLKGISRDGLIYSTDLSTKRSNETISSYLKATRKLVKFMGYENHVLLEKNNISKTIIMPESSGAKTINPFEITVKTINRASYVPAYINIQEFQSILEAAKGTNTPLRDRVICRLMFEHGLRIGEVLGLTLEDIKYRTKKDMSIIYLLELRNRVTDTNEQNVKSVMKVFNRDDYKDPDYRKKNIGYTPIVISEDLAMELLEYINLAHDSGDTRFMQRREQYAHADSVPGGNPDIDQNYYVFLNTLGRPLSENLWDKNLRVIFEKAGLIVDKGVRKNNLNHRLRHGYAMYLTDVMGVSDFDVKTLMRHKNLSTTAIYHNPTPEDVEELQERLIQKWDISVLKGEQDK